MSQVALQNAELKTALTGLGKVINRHPTLPVLNHVRIERSRNGVISLTVTDLDHHLSVRLDQRSTFDPVALLVPYDELLKTSKACGKDRQILIEPSGNGAAIIRYAIGQQFAEKQVQTIPVSEFPPLPEIEGEAVPLPENVRCSIIEAMQCASEDQTRQILNGVYIDVSDGKCHSVVATDGRHLYASNSFHLPLKESVLIPTHRFLGWREFQNDGEWKLKVHTGEDGNSTRPLLEISSEHWTFIAVQQEDRYPNWRGVLRSNSEYTGSIDIAAPDSLIQLIQRMPEHDKANHTLSIVIKGGTFAISGKASPEAQPVTIQFPQTRTVAPDQQIFLNRNLLTKALRFGLTRLEIIDPLSPVRLSNAGRQMIVMPIRPEPVQQKSASAKAEPASKNIGDGEASTAASGTEQKPATPSRVAQQETRTMTNGANTASTTPAENSTPGATIDQQIEAALGEIESLKGFLQESLTGLKCLAAKLKQIQREHRANVREFQSVRQTLKTLQGVRL